jgi:transposase-like protein/predicted phosphodiesterase
MTPRQHEIYDAYVKTGSMREVARQYGLNESSVRGMVKRAKRHLEMDPAVSSAMAAAGMQDADILHSGWIKTETASLYFKVPQEAATNDLLERIREAMDGIKVAEALPPPEHHNSDLMTVYPLFDVHLGMAASLLETGEEYSTDTAAKRVIDCVSKCTISAPPSKHAVILVGGDLLHHNDATNMTKSGHILDVSTRIDETIEVAIWALATAIDIAATRHEHVSVAVIPGNHDRDAYLAVMFALRERYRNNERIEVQRHYGDFFVMEFGQIMLTAHHGDKAKAERLVMHMANEWPEMWGRTKYRYYFTGHLHHAKLQDIGGVQVEQLRAITARDSYSASHAYSARSEMQAITYHQHRGEVSRVRLAL